MNKINQFVCTDCGVGILEAFITNDTDLVDINEMIKTIKEVWGIDVTESYCQALLAFLNLYAGKEEVNAEQTIAIEN